MNRTLAPPEEAKVRGVNLARVDCKRGSGLHGQMEVITMAVAAILIAVGVIALIYLGLFLVVWTAWFIMSSF
jgi:hypothetical protein